MTDACSQIPNTGRPWNNSYPYRVLSDCVCDGTYRDRNFAHNYRWMRWYSTAGDSHSESPTMPVRIGGPMPTPCAR